MWRRFRQYVNAAFVIIDIVGWTIAEYKKAKAEPWLYDEQR